ncbi:hypothetical protein PIB30_090475 [Stylosanthes scabra]|uniref:Uncharacterized protein n=1 Tax=Stylosanthes scabra TaxID=79078 RepID=A0ABU6SVH1_9FABA|nr:hypothetical protein [Stylosanthes scabra]
MVSKGKAPAKASSTRVHGSTSQKQPSLEIRLYETPAHEERGKTLEERKALHECTIKFPEGEDTFEERILARGWGFMYEPSIPINLSWVREFCANKTKKDQGEIFMRGRKITCSVSTIEKTMGFFERNHEVTEEEEVKQSKVAWTEPQSNPGSKLGHVWTRLAQAPKCDPIKDVPRLPTLILSHV